MSDKELIDRIYDRCPSPFERDYTIDQFVDRLLRADCHEVKIIEDFSDLDANTVSDDIVENTQDTMTLLGKYIDDLDVNLDKTKLKTDISKLYHEAQDLEL